MLYSKVNSATAIQDRQCTYNLTQRRVHAPIIAVEQQYVLRTVTVCVSVAFGIQRCNAHAPYFHLWPAPLYNIFCALSHKRHDFRENIIEHKMCVFYFLYNFCLRHFSF